jgi:hypothetical protein
LGTRTDSRGFTYHFGDKIDTDRREIQIFTIVKFRVNKKILFMMFLASFGLVIEMLLVSFYPASEYSFTLGVALAIFGIIIAIQIVLYSKVRKEIP